jgi:hypothetical protein
VRARIKLVLIELYCRRLLSERILVWAFHVLDLKAV